MPIFFLALGGACAPSAPPGYPYVPHPTNADVSVVDIARPISQMKTTRSYHSWHKYHIAIPFNWRSSSCSHCCAWTLPRYTGNTLETYELTLEVQKYTTSFIAHFKTSFRTALVLWGWSPVVKNCWLHDAACKDF